MNFLVIAIDTLRADHLGCYGYRRQTSPNIDALADSGVLFEKLFAPAIPTQPSYTTVYTGQHSITHGIVTHGGQAELSPDAPFLTEILQKAGYHTCAVDNLVRMKPWFARGYSEYTVPEGSVGWMQQIACEDLNRVAVPWLREKARAPFFMFIHYWDPHTPYIPPDRFRDLFYEGDPADPARKDTLAPLWQQPFGEWWKPWFDQVCPNGLRDAEYVVALYDQEIRYVDEGVAELLAALEDSGAADDTLVLIYSDHGEMMYHHDIFFDHHGLYDGNLHVPLIVRAPGSARGRVPHLVQHVDIAPTVLELAGLPTPAAMEGRSLVPYLSGESDGPIYDCLYTEECTWQAGWGIRTDGHKLIMARGPSLHQMPEVELYDLAADPDELHNIAPEHPETVRELGGRLEGWVADMMAKNGLDEDPLVAQGVTLGKKWHDWRKEKGYW